MLERAIYIPDHDFEQARLDFEQKVLRGEVIYSGQTTLRECIKHVGSDPVGLLDAGIVFEVRDLGQSNLYIASFLPNQAPFGGERLVRLLRGAKPVKQRGTQHEREITADWIIIQARKPGSPERFRGNFDELHNKHTLEAAPEIREVFGEVEANHFPEFWDAIQFTLHDGASRYLDIQFKYLMSEEKALAKFGLDFMTADPERFIKIIQRSLNLRNSFSVFLKNKLNAGIAAEDADQFFVQSADLIQTFDSQGQKDLIRGFYHQLPDDKERKRLIYQTVSLYNFPECDLTILVDENGDIHDMLGDVFINDSRFKKLPDGQIEIRHEDCYLKVEFARDEQTGYKEPRIIEKYIPIQKEEIVPVIIWERDKTTGKAEYFCGRISQELIESFPHLFSHNHDILAGKLAVGAYSYDLRENLPPRLPLKPGGKEQEIREAQTLVAIQLYDKLFLSRSPVILGLEELAR